MCADSSSAVGTMFKPTPEQREILEKKLANVKAYSDEAKRRTTNFGTPPIGSYAEDDPEVYFSGKEIDLD